MSRLLTITILLLLACARVTHVHAQASAETELYKNHFALSEVTIGEGILKDAMLLNVEELLEYDHYCLLTPFVRQAGLSETTDSSNAYYNWEDLHPNFENWCWNPSFALDGHVGGHYVSALALGYAATGNSELKARLDYMISVLKDCQDAYAADTTGLKGFIGGQPDNTIWTKLYAGSNSQYVTRAGWVPFYCIHKIFAGLRDAYLYAGNTTALELCLGLADWGIEVVAKFAESDMDSKILYDEHGGMNEIFADMYALTGEAKYLTAAKKYSHQEMVEGMLDASTTFLDYKHANTQVPKYLGFERIAQVDPTATNYHTSAVNFWADVVNNRSVAIGGNSVDEHFLNADNCTSYISNMNGPESCNTNNMLKLSEALWEVNKESKYADFYERAMFNHILSTQDPKTGGYVYFTSLRPQSYKIYSVVNEAMWCCVGTGMENHSKYGHFIYGHSESNDTLYVNLFVDSELNSDHFAIKQTTNFPFEQKTTLTVNKAGTYTIAVRHPSWAGGTAGYDTYTKTWSVGDILEVELPMTLAIEELPNYSDYIAITYGPIVLGAATAEDEELANEYAGVGRMDHAPGSMAASLSLATAPLLICNRDEVLNKITPTDLSRLEFTIDCTHDGGSWGELTLKPFYELQGVRYSVYWLNMTEEEWADSDMANEEAIAAALEARTLDFVATGEQQSEAGHNASYSDSSTKGTANGEYYRDVCYGGYIQYDLSTAGATTEDQLSLMMRYNIYDAGRIGYLYIDDELLCSVSVPSSKTGADPFYNEEYPLPSAMLLDSDGNLKSQITVKLVAPSSGYAPGWYYCRLCLGYEGELSKYSFVCTDWTTGDTGRVAASKFEYNTASNTITVTATGNNNVCLNMTSDALSSKYYTNDETLLVVRGQNLSVASGASYLWWLNGTNKGSSVAPTQAYEREDGTQVIVWGITQSKIDDTMSGSMNSLTGSTIFGLTSTDSAGKTVLTDIGFYTEESLEDALNGIQKITRGADSSSPAYDTCGRAVNTNYKGIIIQNNKARLQLN